MRELTEHKVNPANDRVSVLVMDEPGPGGANHVYRVDLENDHQTVLDFCELRFQNGAISESGVNGITHEALLAVICDRLRAFQAGPYACRENALALTKIEEAQHWLLHRTRARMARSVEGTMQV
jgi:hypothetical protein